VTDETDTDTIDDALVYDEAYHPTFASKQPVFELAPDDGTRPIRRRAPPESLVGAVLDRRFQIVEQIGEGGMGLVYRGVQLSIARPVAIKLIRRHLTHDRMTAKRFLREARILTTFSHPNIVNILELGQTDDGRLYLVMELVQGSTLDHELAHTGRFDAHRTCAVAMQLCDALAIAHAHDIVHRDLKPANIMLGTDLAQRDVVKVLDFGVAKPLAPSRRGSMTGLTAAGTVMGTPLYMSPEAASGEPVDPRSDLYSLGCIMHELLTGSAPFADPAVHVVIARQLGDPPPPLPRDVPPRLARLIAALLEKSPEQRPACAARVHAELRACLQPEPPQLDPLDDELPTTPRSPPRAEHRTPTWIEPVRRPPLPWLAASAAATVLLALLLAVAPHC
jgi:serine/threonine protein kinase